jgi:hypothetical protein
MKKIAFSELMEQRAEKLSPGEENYCFHEDKQVVYYGGDWENDEDEDEDGGRFFTVEQLTTGFEATKKKIKDDLKKKRRDYPTYSFNDVIEMYRYSKKMGYDDFEKFMNESR